MKKNKYLIFSSFIIIFIFLSAGSAFAALEVTYPTIPGLPNINQNNPGISEFVGYFFGLGIYIAGVLSLISFTIGAIGIVAASATGDPSKRGDAMDRIKGAVLGLVLTMASFVIIRTINTNLITPSLTPLPGVQGVFYTNGKEKKPVGIEVSDVANRGEDLIKNGFNSIIYDCKDDSLAPALLIWEFPNKGLEAGNPDYKGVRVMRKFCGGTEPISGLGSFRMAFETPGVYYCLGGCSGGLCSGYMSGVKTASQDKIEEAFAGKIKGVRFVNSDSIDYGIIFHKVAGLQNGGECNYPITGSGCYSIDSAGDPLIQASAADIYIFNKNPISSGDGVDFYSEPFGWTSGKDAGYYKVSSNMINPAFTMKADYMCYDYKNVSRPDYYKYKCYHEEESKCEVQDNMCDPENGDADCLPGETCSIYTYSCVGENDEVFCSDTACETFQDCPGSIDIKGKYLVAVYSKDTNKKTYCQTFTKDVENLKTKQIIVPGEKQVEGVYIIPTK
ncbi:MAG: pilin [Candidatus Pacebacteria bacterium]|nr:pilin [Candidatus Paceibacterota bacterium]